VDFELLYFLFFILFLERGGEVGEREMMTWLDDEVDIDNNDSSSKDPSLRGDKDNNKQGFLSSRVEALQSEIHRIAVMFPLPFEVYLIWNISHFFLFVAVFRILLQT